MLQTKVLTRFQQKEDFNVIASIEEYERKALIEEAQAEMLEGDKDFIIKYLTSNWNTFNVYSDEKEKQKKQRLLGDFGRNFHGYIR